jgi:uncharacterized OB-fold protein
MIPCRQCGKMISPTATTCWNCGANQASVAVRKSCPQCGNRFDHVRNATCPKCGKKNR